MNADFLQALTMFAKPHILLYLALGGVIGTVFSAIPGLTSTLALALLLPFTYNMDPFSAFVLLVGMFAGGVYGGSLTAITISIPGAPGSVCTCLDGYPLFKKGQGGKAIGLATFSSVFGGCVSAVILAVAAPQLAKVALRFGPPEYFSLALFGMTAVVAIGTDMVKSVLAGLFGLLLGTVGVDILGRTRLTLGIPALMVGIPLLPTVVGLFAIARVFEAIHEGNPYGSAKIEGQISKMQFPTWQEIKSLWRIFVRQSLIGTFIGFLPGAGANIAAFTAYNIEKRLSKNPEKFGTGCLEGVAAPETANNATTGGALIPLLTLGIPGDQFTAVLMGAFLIHGLPVGPLLFREHQSLLYVIFLTTFLSNFVFLGLGYFGCKHIIRLALVRESILIPVVAAFSLMGAYAAESSIIHLTIGVVFGIIAFALERVKFPMGPIVLGLILSKLIEQSLVQSLIMSKGNVSIFFTRPLSLMFLVLAVVFAVIPLVASKGRKAENVTGAALAN